MAQQVIRKNEFLFKIPNCVKDFLRRFRGAEIIVNYGNICKEKNSAIQVSSYADVLYHKTFVYRFTTDSFDQFEFEQRLKEIGVEL